MLFLLCSSHGLLSTGLSTGLPPLNTSEFQKEVGGVRFKGQWASVHISLPHYKASFKFQLMPPLTSVGLWKCKVGFFALHSIHDEALMNLVDC